MGDDTSLFWTVSYQTIGNAIRALWRVRIEGREHIPKEGPAIIASNHLSFMDHFILPLATPRQIFFISKVQHFDDPVKRWFFTRWGVIPLRRGEGDDSAFARSVEALERGNLFGIYPEGTRSLDGKLHKGHTGVARLALLTGAPVVPAAMLGTFKCMPKGKSRPALNKLGVRLGPPLHFGKDPDAAEDRATLRQVTDEIMRAIQTVSGQEYVDEYQKNPEYRSAAHGYRSGTEEELGEKPVGRGEGR